MNYNIIASEHFKREAKNLIKKYPSLKKDLALFEKNIEKELLLAVDLGDGFKKIRINISSKGKGKSGGGRIITHETIINVCNKNSVLGSIYDKSKFDTIDIAILKKILGIE